MHRGKGTRRVDRRRRRQRGGMEGTRKSSKWTDGQTIRNGRTRWRGKGGGRRKFAERHCRVTERKRLNSNDRVGSKKRLCGNSGLRGGCGGELGRGRDNGSTLRARGEGSLRKRRGRRRGLRGRKERCSRNSTTREGSASSTVRCTLVRVQQKGGCNKANIVRGRNVRRGRQEERGGQSCIWVRRAK